MQAHNLLLARKYTERSEHIHDDKVIVMRSNLRWCSDGFEFTCWNGDIVRGAFLIDAHDREIIAWRTVVNAAIICRPSGHHEPSSVSLHTLKVERVHHRTYATRAEARRDLFAYSEGFYNSRRMHSAIGCRSPADKEKTAA